MHARPALLRESRGFDPGSPFCSRVDALYCLTGSVAASKPLAELSTRQLPTTLALLILLAVCKNLIIIKKKVDINHIVFTVSLL
jgi:hypothetical protein